jgi:hypothetical protein
MSLFTFGGSSTENARGEEEDGDMFGISSMAKRLSLSVPFEVPSPISLFGMGSTEIVETPETAASRAPKKEPVHQESVFKRFKLAPQGRLVSRPVCCSVSRLHVSLALSHKVSPFRFESSSQKPAKSTRCVTCALFLVMILRVSGAFCFVPVGTLGNF